MNRRRWWSAAVVGAMVFAAALALPLLVPVSGLIPQIAVIAADKLGQPVEIAELRLALLPTPRVVANGIRIGRKDQVRIGELEIVPDLLSFVFGPRTLRLVRAERVALRESALRIPRGMPKGGAGAPLELRRLVLKEVTLGHSKMKLPLFDLEADLGPAYEIERARLETRDGLKARIFPDGSGSSAIELEARNWTLPAGAPLAFERLAARGQLRPQGLGLPAIEAAFYGGRLEGSLWLDWAKQWRLGGEAKLAGVDVVPLQRALGKPPRLSGRLKAEARFSARARSPDLLGGAFVLDGPFEIVGGAYQGVDLAKVGDITGSVAPGDATSFEQFTGKAEVRGERIRINELCVRSPKVVAGGFVEVDADERLSGKLDVSLARTSGFVGVPVALGGTASDPSVRPTKGYVIGAVIGTVLLPGIGTSLGSSVGRRVEGSAGGCK